MGPSVRPIRTLTRANQERCRACEGANQRRYDPAFSGRHGEHASPWRPTMEAPSPRRPNRTETSSGPTAGRGFVWRLVRAGGGSTTAEADGRGAERRRERRVGRATRRRARPPSAAGDDGDERLVAFAALRVLCPFGHVPRAIEDA